MKHYLLILLVTPFLRADMHNSLIDTQVIIQEIKNDTDYEIRPLVNNEEVLMMNQKTHSPINYIPPHSSIEIELYLTIKPKKGKNSEAMSFPLSLIDYRTKEKLSEDLIFIVDFDLDRAHILPINKNSDIITYKTDDKWDKPSDKYLIRVEVTGSRKRLKVTTHMYAKTS